MCAVVLTPSLTTLSGCSALNENAENESNTEINDMPEIPEGDTGESVTEEASGNKGSEDSDIADAVDTDAFERFLLREISVELTYDNIPDNISLYLLGDSSDNLRNAEYLIESKARMVQAVVTDGATQKILYDRTFSIDHVGEGELALVTDGKRYFLMESGCYEQQGYASYYGEVFEWGGGEKRIVDGFSADFLISLDAVCRGMEAGDDIILREDAIPAFEKSVQNWYCDSELLVACDTVNSLNGVQSVYISLDEKQYSLEDYFSSIWDRRAEKFITGTFDNIMGYSGFYIYDNTYAFPYGYFYAVEDGRPFCIAESWGGLEDDNFIVDINNDGENELICNLMYGDGAQSTGIYYKDNGNVLFGFADDMLDKEYDDIGLSARYSMYLPDENVVEIFYWKEDLQDYRSDKYEVDLDKISFSPFTPSQ